jgi:flagellar hook-length control protein FliK
MAALLSAESDLPESLSGPLAGAASVSSKGGVIAGLQPPADAPLPTAMRVQVAFGHAQWSEAVAERSAWLASQQIHSAELQLDPPELGPLQVRISVHQDQAVVSFVSANPQVREALDQSMMRLRELLQEQGMQLVDAGVSDQQRGDRDSGNGDTSEGLAAGNVAGQGPEIDPAQGGVVDTRYGVDDFV